MTGRVRRKSWLLLAAMLAIASAIVLVWLQSTEVISSLVRDPLSDFVQPGITVWWFVLGGPFRTAPSSAGGIAFAAVANAFLAPLTVACGASARRNPSPAGRVASLAAMQTEHVAGGDRPNGLDVATMPESGSNS